MRETVTDIIAVEDTRSNKRLQPSALDEIVKRRG
jgi:hypothetical protein